MALTVSNVTNPGLTGVPMQMKGVNDGSAAAAAIYCGFTPRYIQVVNITDKIRDEYFPDATAGSSIHTTAAGAVSEAANGFTMLTDTHATIVKATGSPQSSGPGFALGTGILLASKTYQITVWP